MARVLGYGVGNTNGVRDFSGKTEGGEQQYAFRDRTNPYNRRRYGGLWFSIALLLVIG